MTVFLNKDNFEAEVMEATVPVLLDFFADWCMPCKMLSPVIDEISDEAEGAKVCKINVDEEPELAAQFQVMSIPTLMVLRNGQVTRRIVGLHPKEEIMLALKA